MRHPDELTDVQLAFLKGMTDQRVANIWDAADFIADLSPEAREFLLKADKEKIEKLNSTIRFMGNAGLIAKVAWITGATLFTTFIAITKFWEAVRWVAENVSVKIK